MRMVAQPPNRRTSSQLAIRSCACFLCCGFTGVGLYIGANAKIFNYDHWLLVTPFPRLLVLALLA